MARHILKWPEDNFNKAMADETGAIANANVKMDQFITDGENLDEELSVNEFIKTLKRVESNDTIQSNSNDSGRSPSVSSSTDKLSNTKSDEKKIDKKGSTNDLLLHMRKRFVHRATEPIFHALEGQQSRSFAANSSSGGGSDNALRMPIVETILERKTDSEPALSKSHTKYLATDQPTTKP